MQLLFHQITRPADDKAKKAGFRRLAEAMFDQAETQSRREEKPGSLELDATFTSSADEVLRSKDFEQMTLSEQAEARRAIAAMRIHRTEVKTRRFRAAAHGDRIDLRRTLKGSLRAGGHVIALERRERRWREPPLVVLCDISGSCSNYSRMFLHFLHALINDRETGRPRGFPPRPRVGFFSRIATRTVHRKRRLSHGSFSGHEPPPVRVGHGG